MLFTQVQQYKELSNNEYFSKNVGINVGKLKNNINAKILITTIENLNKMDEKTYDNIDTVIFDDFHYMYNLNAFKISINKLPSNIKLLFLSEPITSVNEITDSISNIREKNVYIEINENRSIPLKHEIYHSGWIYTLADSTKKENKNKLIFYEAKYNEAKSHETEVSITEARYWSLFLIKLKQLSYLPSLIYSFDTKNCDKLAQFCIRIRYLSPPELNYIEKYINNDILSNLPEKARSSENVTSLLELLKCGIGVHHENIIPQLREHVETLFADGYLKVIFCVPSKNVFISTPVRSVCFSTIKKRMNEKTTILTPDEYAQFTSKAGRRGIDIVGSSIICMDKNIMGHDNLY